MNRQPFSPHHLFPDSRLRGFVAESAAGSRFQLYAGVAVMRQPCTARAVSLFCGQCTADCSAAKPGAGTSFPAYHARLRHPLSGGSPDSAAFLAGGLRGLCQTGGRGFARRARSADGTPDCCLRSGVARVPDLSSAVWVESCWVPSAWGFYCMPCSWQQTFWPRRFCVCFIRRRPKKIRFRPICPQKLLPPRLGLTCRAPSAAPWTAP